MYRLEIEHNAEAAHRFFLTRASDKCCSIHGHSWKIILTLKAKKLNSEGMIIEFGQLKAAWRSWLDTYVDHTLMLHQADPMVTALRAVDPNIRLFLIPADPTTENLAQVLFEQAKIILKQLECDPFVEIERVRLEETQVNAAEYLSS